MFAPKPKKKHDFDSLGASLTRMAFERAKYHHFGKPLYSAPLGNQIEQRLVAHYVEKEGFGIAADPPAEESFGEFLRRRDEFAANIAAESDRFDGNDALFAEVDAQLERLAWRAGHPAGT